MPEKVSVPFDESGHLLTNNYHYGGAYAGNADENQRANNLMTDGNPRNFPGIGEGCRLTVEQEKMIYNPGKR